LFKDVFRFHWMEESQHAVLDELEWAAENVKLDAEARNQAVSDLIELVAAVDGLLRLQSANDATYFIEQAGRTFEATQQEAIKSTFLAAYRYQYVLSGIESTRFPDLLRSMLDEAQYQRVVAALAPLM
jgi:hypothetical protein